MGLAEICFGWRAGGLPVGVCLLGHKASECLSFWLPGAEMWVGALGSSGALKGMAVSWLTSDQVAQSRTET